MTAEDFLSDAKQPSAEEFLSVSNPSAEDFLAKPEASTTQKILGTPLKAAAALNQALTAADIGVGTTLARISDPGPRPNSFRQHEQEMLLASKDMTLPKMRPDGSFVYPTLSPAERAAATLDARRQMKRDALTAPGLGFAEGGREVSDEFKQMREGTPGYEAPAKAAEFVGGALPYVAEAAIPVVGPAIAAAHGGAQSGGEIWQEAYDSLRQQGVPDEDAKKQADQIATSIGSGSAAIFAALPGPAKGIASKLVAERFATRPVLQALARTAAAGGEAGTVMASDSLQRDLQAKETFDPSRPTEQILLNATKAFATGTAFGTIVHGPGELKTFRPAPAPVQTSEPAAPAYSEFGGEVKEEPAEPVQGPTPNVQSPVPETPATIAAQVEVTKDPETPKAVTLVTPGAEVPDNHGLVEVETEQGTALVNPEKVDPVEAKAQLDAGAGGQLLGMSTEQKPEGAAHVLQTKTENWTPVQDEVVTPATLPAAAEAGRRLAPNGTQELRTPEAVIAERNARPLSTVERKYLGEDIKAREPIRADVVQRAIHEGGFALPTGYELQGDKFIFKEPAPVETPAARMAREQREASASIRGRRAEGGSQPTEAPRPSNPTDRPEPGTPIPTFERPPDVLDDIENLFGGVGIPDTEDFADFRAAVKELSQNKSVGLSGGKLKRLFQGEPPDTALQGLHAEGLQLRIQTPEKLFDEMIKSAKRRIKWHNQEQAAAKPKPSTKKPAPGKETIQSMLDDLGPPGLLTERIEANRGNIEFLEEQIAHQQYALERLRDPATRADTQRMLEMRQQELREALSHKKALESELYSVDNAPFNLVLASENEPRRPGLNAKWLEANIGDLQKGLPGAPELKVVQSVKDLPEQQRVRVEGEAARGKRVQGIFDEGKAWLIADNIKDVPTARKTYLEETLGHGGMEPLIKPREVEQMFDLIQRGAPEKAAEIARLYEHDLKSPSGRAEFVGEFVAKASEWSLQKPNLYRRLADFVTRIAGRVGWLRNIAPAQVLDATMRGLARRGKARLAALDEKGIRRTRSGLAEAASQNDNTTRPRFSLAPDEGERATGLKIQDSSEISDPVKAAVTEYLYKMRSNTTDQETADGLVKDFGADRAAEIYRDPPAAMPGAVRSKLLGSITRDWATQERIARASQKTGVADSFAEKQAQLWNEALPQITELAQSLQALNDLIDMSPDGHVARTRRRLEEVANDKLDLHRPELEQIKQAIEEGRKEGIEAVRQDPSVNNGVRAAVDEAVATSAETHQAVIMDLAGPWSESPEILRMAREQVRAKADELLNRAPRPPGLSPAQHLRVMLDDLAKRAADIAGGHYQGAEPGVTLRDKLMQRLGLGEDHATRLAKQLDAEFARQMEAAKGKLDKRIAAVRVKQTELRGLTQKLNAERRALDAANKVVREAAVRAAKAENELRVADTVRKREIAKVQEAAAKRAHDAALKVVKEAAVRAAKAETALRVKEAEMMKWSSVERSIHKELREWNEKLGEIIYKEPAAQSAQGKHVADRIVQASGLTGPKAEKLRALLQNRWNALVGGAQERKLQAIEKRSGVTVKRPMRDAFAKLVELDRLSGVNGDRFRDVAKAALKLKSLSDAEAKELREMVQRAQEQPAGFLRERAAAQVLQTTEKLAGNIRWWDIPMGIFYSNVLSGLTTPAKIIFENTNLLVGNTLTEFLSRPVQNVLHPIDFASQLTRAYGRGLQKGALQAEGTLRTGIVTGVWERGRTNIMESKPFGRFEPLNFWKYFSRVIGTAHEVTFKPAWEIRQTMTARAVAQREGLHGKALDQRVADLLANTEAEVTKAKGQALAEMQQIGNVNRADLTRRTLEILEQRREENMPGSSEAARDFALRTAYLNEPYGFLGLIATGVRSVLEKGRKEFPVAGTLAKTQIPFTTVVANILNEKLNWGPVGLLRAVASEKTGKLYGRPIVDSNERAQLYAKAIVGTVLMGATAELFGSHIHGNGPASPQKRKQLQATGWIPHSVEYNGRYYSYMNTPAALNLAVVGNYLDWHRYGKGADAESVDRVAFATKATANAIVSQGMLDSLRRFFEAMGSESTSEGGDKLEKLAARTTSAFVVPNLVQQVDRFFDPTIYDQTGIKALLNGQVPFARRENKPVLNVLGEPVQSDPFHYWTSKQTGDPLWRLIVEKQAFIPEPSRSAIIGNEKFGAGYYRAITPDEYYDLIAESGPKIRSDLEKLLPQLETMPADQVQAVVQSIANKYHEAAKAKLKP